MPLMYLKLKLLVKLHREPGETLTHSVQLWLYLLRLSGFDCVDCQHHHFMLCLCIPCWLNQFGNNWLRTHIPRLLAFRNLDAIVLLYVRFNVSHAIVFGVIWIIRVPITLELSFGVRNTFWCAILISFDWMMIASSDSADD